MIQINVDTLFQRQIRVILDFHPSSGTHIRVLMFINTMEIKRLVVNEELGLGNVDCADADWQSIHIFIC